MGERRRDDVRNDKTVTEHVTLFVIFAICAVVYLKRETVEFGLEKYNGQKRFFFCFWFPNRLRFY